MMAALRCERKVCNWNLWRIVSREELTTSSFFPVPIELRSKRRGAAPNTEFNPPARIQYCEQRGLGPP